MVWYAWALVAMDGLGALVTANLIGKPREPLTPFAAFLTWTVEGLAVWAIVSLAT